MAKQKSTDEEVEVLTSEQYLERFISCLDYYQVKVREHDEAKKACVTSWGYFGYSYIVAMEDAKQRLAEAFNAAVDARIRKAQQ